MGIMQKLRAYRTAFRDRRRDRPLDLMRLLRRRPALMLGVNAFEISQFVSHGVDDRLKALAQVKTSALIGCPF
jgi:hypothetical protein